MVKIITKSFFVLLFFISSLFLSAQAVHFSYIDFAPQHINPGNIGGFLGSYRGAGIFRDQYNNGSQVRGFRNFEIGLDLPILRGFRKQDWIGVGISIDSDTRGTLKLRDVYSRMGASYHFGLNPKSTNVITLGFQMVSINRSINTQLGSDFTPEGILTGKNTELLEWMKSGQSGGGAGGSQRQSITARDYVLGLVYTANTPTNQIKLGLSGSGFLPSEIGFRTNADTAGVPFKLIGFASMVNQINKTISIEPTALFQTTEYGGREFMVNAKVGMKLKEDKKDKVKFGIGFRTGTLSAIFLAGAEIRGINFGLSYDLPLSGYSDATGVQNGFEMGASYIGLFKKTPKRKPIVICPRL